MEIRLIFFKEIVGVISLKTEVKYLQPKHLRSRENILTPPPLCHPEVKPKDPAIAKEVSSRRSPDPSLPSG